MEAKLLATDDDDSGMKQLSKLTVDDDNEEMMTSLASEAKDAEEEEEEDIAEHKLDLEVEREWKHVRYDATGPGRIEVSSNPRAQRICHGLVINHMNMRCGDTGTLLWQSEECGEEIYTREQTARIPSAILQCRAVAREINFSSAEEILQFRLEQRVFLGDCCIEEWLFTFGYVIPGSTNTWQQTIEAAGPDAMLDPETVSGQITIETAFYDGDLPIAKTIYRIFYV